MRSTLGKSLTSLVAVALAVVAAMPTVAATTRGGSVQMDLLRATCDPRGVAGLSVTVGAIATDTTIRSAELAVFEYQPITDTRYAPFTWTGGSVCTWINEDSFRTAITTDSRTLDTTDLTTWSRGNYYKDVWAGSRPDSWWQVAYWVTPASRTLPMQRRYWYVSCPTGRIVPDTSLAPLENVSVTGLR